MADQKQRAETPAIPTLAGEPLSGPLGELFERSLRQLVNASWTRDKAATQRTAVSLRTVALQIWNDGLSEGEDGSR